jgi:SAM-dependent methyltransferase
MSGFSAEWLALREPYDVRARNPAVLDALAAAFRGLTAVGIVDLACGTGATLRAIAPRLPQRQNWRLADNDLGLLARAGALTEPPHRSVAARAVDLARDLELALEEPLDLVTCSALLDLVSGEWLERLVVEAAARRLPVYAALSYDGEAALDPADPFDADMIAAVNMHQRRNKGFGPALGPAAADEAIKRFERLGYSVVQGRSDWVFEPDDAPIQSEVLYGWAAAARQLGELPAEGIAAWLSGRSALVVAHRSRMRIGHVDFFARPGA